MRKFLISDVYSLYVYCLLKKCILHTENQMASYPKIDIRNIAEFQIFFIQLKETPTHSQVRKKAHLPKPVE